MAQKLKKAATPYILAFLMLSPFTSPRGAQASLDTQPFGGLASAASRSLIQVLYAGRMACHDLLWSVSLSSQRTSPLDVLRFFFVTGRDQSSLS